MSPTTVTKYVVAGVLPRTTFRGTATRYQREHLIRLLAIRELRSQGVVNLANIKAHLATFTATQLEQWVLSRPQSPQVLAALAEDAETEGTSSNAEGHSTVSPENWPQLLGAHGLGPNSATGGAAALGPQTWQHVHLTPTIVLSWTVDANESTSTLVALLMRVLNLGAHPVDLE